MEINAEKVKERVIKGVGSLVLRTLTVQVISFFGFLFLSVFLDRWELGIFWAVSEIIGFLGYFSDIGLAAALIQKKDRPAKEEIRTTFTIQQVLVFSLIILTVLLTPYLQVRFNFGQEGRLLLYALLFGFFAASLKTIPSVLLERELKFDKLALVDLTEQFTFTGLAVFLAWRGMGVQSWTLAILIRSIIGLVLIYIFSPWPVGFNFKFKTVKSLFKFGIPYQLNSFLAVVKDRLVNIFFWGILGSEGIGILGWAQRWAQTPLRFLMDAAIRVTFPAYSRVQEEKERLRQFLEKSVFSVNFIIFPLLAGMALLMPKVIDVFPQYQKWLVAVIPLYWYLANFSFGVATTPLVNAFNAVGKINLTLKLMIFWTGLTWILVPIFSREYGVNGASFALFLVSSTSVFVWYLARKEFSISLKKVILTPLTLTVLMAVPLAVVNRFLPANIFSLVAAVIFGGLSYFLFSLILVKKDLLFLLKSVKSSLLKR